jgi:hypothetical protein
LLLSFIGLLFDRPRTAAELGLAVSAINLALFLRLGICS